MAGAVKCVCIRRKRNDKGVIEEYMLKDRHGKVVVLKAKEVKAGITAGKLDVLNLTLTKDNRIIEKQIKKPMQREKTEIEKIINNAILKGGNVYQVYDSEICDKSIRIADVGGNVAVWIPDNVTYVHKLYSAIRGSYKNLAIFGGEGLTDIEDMLLYIKCNELNLTNLVTKKVQNMSHMFDSCEACKIKFGNFNTSSVTNMECMFRRVYFNTSFCENEDAPMLVLDISMFNTKSVINMQGMFDGCRAKIIGLDKFDMSYVENISEMFRYMECPELTFNWNTIKVSDMSFVFCGTTCKNFNVKLNTANVKNMHSMFSKSTLDKIDLTGFDVRNVVDMEEMFSFCNAPIIKLGTFKANKVRTTRKMFIDCGATRLDLKKFSTEVLEDASCMFQGCWAKELDLGSLNTEYTSDMSYMFSHCKATKINVSSFITSFVTDMTSMFEDTKVVELNLTNFDTSSVERMSCMFKDSEVKKLDISSFSFLNTEYTLGMFEGVVADIKEP